MIKVEYFVIEETPYAEDKYTIRLNFDKLPNISTYGSFGILPARLMNLSYAQYLRFCRDIIGAELIGKNTKYPYPLFKKNKELMAFVRLLNTRMNCVLWEKEHPDWQEHQEYLAKWKKEADNNVSNS